MQRLLDSSFGSYWKKSCRLSQDVFVADHHMVSYDSFQRKIGIGVTYDGFERKIGIGVILDCYDYFLTLMYMYCNTYCVRIFFI